MVQAPGLEGECEPQAMQAQQHIITDIQKIIDKVVISEEFLQHLGVAPTKLQ